MSKTRIGLALAAVAALVATLLGVGLGAANATAPAVAAAAATTTAAPAARGWCVRSGTGELRNLWFDPSTGKCPVPFWGPVALGGGAAGPAGPAGPKGDPGDGATRFISKTVDVAANAGLANVVLTQPKGSILIAAGVSPHGAGTSADAAVGFPASGLTGSGSVRLASAAAVATGDTPRTFTVTGGTAADKVTVWLAVALAPA